MEEPAHIVNGNLLIMSLESKEQKEQERLEQLRSKHG